MERRSPGRQVLLWGLVAPIECFFLTFALFPKNNEKTHFVVLTSCKEDVLLQINQIGERGRNYGTL